MLTSRLLVTTSRFMELSNIPSQVHEKKKKPSYIKTVTMLHTIIFFKKVKI